MRFRKIALALFACLALGAFAANATQAAEGEGWTIGTNENQTTAGTLIPNGTHERVTCKKHGTSSLSVISTLLGASVELTAAGVDCLEKAGTTNAATIDNTTSKGHSEGVLTFTGVSVIKPTHCSVANNELTTSQLTDKVIMDPGFDGTNVFDRFFPEVAANGFITITFEGAECTLAGNSATLKGSLCGESVHTKSGTEYEPNKTGTLTTVQTLLFDLASEITGSSTKEPCALTLGTKEAQFRGVVDTSLASGKPFGAD